MPGGGEGALRACADSVSAAQRLIRRSSEEDEFLIVNCGWRHEGRVWTRWGQLRLCEVTRCGAREHSYRPATVGPHQHTLANPGREHEAAHIIDCGATSSSCMTPDDARRACLCSLEETDVFPQQRILLLLFQPAVHTPSPHQLLSPNQTHAR